MKYSKYEAMHYTSLNDVFENRDPDCMKVTGQKTQP